MKLLTLTAFNIFCWSGIFAQKPSLDISTPELRRWPHVSDARISNNGLYVTYLVIDSPLGSNSLVMRSSDGVWERRFSSGEVNTAFFTSDSKCIVFSLPGDSLGILKLGKDSLERIPNVVASKLVSNEQGDWLLYLCSDPARELVMLNLKTGEKRKQGGVTTFYCADSARYLLTAITEKVNGETRQSLSWVDLLSHDRESIWEGTSEIYNLAIDYRRRLVAFITEEERSGKRAPQLWYHAAGMPRATKQIDDDSKGVDANLIIDKDWAPEFSKTGDRIFFHLKATPLPKPNQDMVMLDVWNYKDLRLQSDQLQAIKRSQSFLAVTDIGTQTAVRLQYENERAISSHAGQDDYAIVYTYFGHESWWNSKARTVLYRESTVDGSREIIRNTLTSSPIEENFKFSPSGKWMIYYDEDLRAWLSFESKYGIFRNITRNIPYAMYNDNVYGERIPLSAGGAEPMGIGAWAEGDTAVLIYDNYDIWKVDLLGRKNPVNLTRSYGRVHHIKFRLIAGYTSRADTLLLSAFDVQNKYNGFYQMHSQWKEPRRLSMEPCIMHIESQQVNHGSDAQEEFLIKARDTNLWVISRRSDTMARNFYITSDFRTYHSISNLQPHTSFNWLKAELLHWKGPGGKEMSGILYTPEDFNANKKYPVICNYYELHSDQLYDYPLPYYTNSTINIPFFVSLGYIVFVPDIKFKPGYPGQSALNAVMSGLRYLSRRSYIDSSRLGILGHSFGGFETFYLVTHAHLFAAAVGSAGTADLISSYSGLKYGKNGFGESAQFFYETAQGRMFSSLWGRQDLYLENSSILRADKISTPLLMMHNKEDGNVPFSQAVEMFTAMRRLGKPVWLLQYDHGEHGLTREEDAKEYTFRLQQFFDHYLKGAPAPIWMTQGIPARQKGLTTGYNFDLSGNCGEDCKVCKMWNEKWKSDTTATLKEIQEKAMREHWAGEQLNQE